MKRKSFCSIFEISISVSYHRNLVSYHRNIELSNLLLLGKRTFCYNEDKIETGTKRRSVTQEGSIMNIKEIRNIKEYEKMFPTSRTIFEEAKKYIPAGVNSTARAVCSGWEPYPLFVQSGQGSRVTDVDGNEFIDYLLGLGPMLYRKCYKLREGLNNIWKKRRKPFVLWKKSIN